MLNNNNNNIIIKDDTGLKIRFPILGNVQCRAKFHVDFSETEGNFALYCTISLTFPSMQIEGNATFFLV